MRHAVGVHGNDDAGQDAEQANGGPHGDDGRGGFLARQRIDDATEQDGLGELDDGERDARSGKRPGAPLLGPQQRQTARVDFEQFHEEFPRSQCCGLSLPRFSRTTQQIRAAEQLPLRLRSLRAKTDCTGASNARAGLRNPSVAMRLCKSSPTKRGFP